MFHTPGQYFDAVQEPRVKPVVKAAFIDAPEIGFRCTIVPKDHPAIYLNHRIAYSSAVVAITEDGFETANTFYVKA